MEDENNIGADLDFRESEALPKKTKKRGFTDSISPAEAIPAPEGLLQGILHRITASIKEQDIAVAKSGDFIPATEPSFIARLDRALQKNFDYLIR